MKALDLLWSKCVRMETGPHCIVPGCTRGAQHAHHVYPRSRYPEHRYDADFGVACCAEHHPVLDLMNPLDVWALVQERFPDRAARMADKIAHRPPKTNPKEQRALLRARMNAAEHSNWMDLECCDVEV